jgi:hypothetical protein
VSAEEERAPEEERTPEEEEHAESGFPEPSGRDPGDRSKDPEPHDALSNPADDPDETEWPDPYDKRPDPRFEDHPATGSESTSDPHPSDDPEAEPWEGPKRDKVDD